MLCNGICMDNQMVICNTSLNCDNHANTKHCTAEKEVQTSGIGHGIGHVFCATDRLGMMYTNATLCDGIPECYSREDECNIGCKNESKFCAYHIYCHTNETTPVKPEGILLKKRQYCDGYPANKRPDLSCKEGFDELNCPHRFTCKNRTQGRLNIDDDQVCDGKLDCEDGSDETESLCSETRFYCLNKRPLSVPMSDVENGIKDCEDNSDECPTFTEKAGFVSSAQDLVGGDFLRAWLWILGIFSLVANFIVFGTTVYQLKSWHLEPLKKAFTFFIFNIAVSDLFMSVYLLGISIKGVQYSGRYCYHDVEWRCSVACSILGAFSIISSTVSALLLALMATFRLVSVYNPIKMGSVKTTTFVMPVVFIWILGLVLAFLPLVPLNSGYFVNSVWLRNYFFPKQEITKLELLGLVHRVPLFMSNASTSQMNWFQSKNFILQYFPVMQIQGEYGYFGESSVCLPDLFLKVGSNAWEYSAFLLTLNFTLFLYMFCSYMAIIKRSRRMKSENKKNKKMQTTVALLVFTNFCCVVPISIISYITLAGVSYNPVLYKVSAGFLLPINSSVDPIIYSNEVVNAAKKIYNHLRKTVRDIRSD
uniref:relaxin receptor 1-like n=1 Tax=Ciona intestinalis TaxID=7719 RepID=UPI000EF526D0|nr:relaxin receptor 1-like [Ciona intestinalis]|eukprot:XP_026695443.1 relaxin receptor 1-like [Ciona intestinalis]